MPHAASCRQPTCTTTPEAGLKPHPLAAGLVLGAAVSCADAADAPWHLQGDLGLGVERVQASAPGARGRTRPIPYAYADFGPLFVREDTFGAKLLPLGYGSLELVARASTEGVDSQGRRDPRPLGLGTFQETPWGGVFVDAFQDTVSGGSLLEASYAAQFKWGTTTWYPQAGLARRSARYVDHLFGVPAAEAAAGGPRAYAPGAAVTPTFALSAEWALAGSWILVGHIQRERFDDAIARSPRVAAAGRTSAMLALAWRFD